MRKLAVVLGLLVAAASPACVKKQQPIPKSPTPADAEPTKGNGTDSPDTNGTEKRAPAHEDPCQGGQ